MIKQLFVRWLICVLILPGLFNPAVVHAQAQPAASLVQRAISGILQKKMATRGFASNDPRWSATLTGTGTAIAGGAAAAAVVTLAGVTAPAWVTTGAVIALGALFTAGIDLAIDGIKWAFKGDGSITYPIASGTYPSQKGPDTFVYGQWRAGNALGIATYWALDYNAALQRDSPQAGASVGLEQCETYGNGTWMCSFSYSNPSGTTPNWYRISGSSQQGVAYTCDGTTVNGVCQPPLSTGGAGSETGSPTKAVQSLSDGDKAKPVNPVVLAAIADQAWKNAASQPGYNGYPYDAANPITTADAAAYQQANPQAWPKVADLVAPQPSTSANPNPWSLPNSAAEPAPSEGTDKPPPETDPTFDWSIPNTGETIGKQAVPVSYVPTVFAAPTGCPAPITFTMMDKQYTIAYGPFCDLMVLLAPIFLACGAAAAAIIFMQSLKS